MKEIKELVRMSNEIGKFKDLVQAGGGNTSVKTPDGKMTVKASGLTFSEMTTQTGFVILDYDKILNFFQTHIESDLEENEKLYNIALKESMINTNFPSPSMESGMHTFLDRVVVHTHPIMANIINCMTGGEKIAQELFSNLRFLWLEYKNPGYNLAKEIKSQVYSYETKNGFKPELIFLKNHGIIVSDTSSLKCVNLTTGVNKKIYEYLKNNFGIENFVDPAIRFENGLHFNDNAFVKDFIENLDENKHLLSSFLIPDDAVYCSQFSIKENLNLDMDRINFVRNQGLVYPWDEKKSAKINEMVTAKLYIISVLQKIGKIEFLKDVDVRYILNMESEKYRQKLN